MSQFSSNMFSSNMALARRLESLEAASVLKMVASVVRNSQGSSAVSEPHLGGSAIFAGLESPMTHAMGIGMQGPATETEFEAMEQFFASNGSACLIDLCPLAHESVIDLVRTRGYQILEFNDVMVRDLTEPMPAPKPSSFSIDPVPPEEILRWCKVLTRGFAGQVPGIEEMAEQMAAASADSECYLAREVGGADASRDGIDAGGAAMNIHEGGAGFAGDCTLEGFRNRGLQSELILRRMIDARASGCDLAMACVLPGSASHRNYERAGFRLAYMRVNVRREITETE